MADSEDDNQRKLIAAGLGGLAVALFGAGLYSMFANAPPPPPARAPMAMQPVLQQQQPAPQGPPTQGGPVPDFELERLTGGTVKLADLKGKVIVIDFWATWCPPCRAEMPWLVEMAKKLESRGVAFVAISEDDPPGQVPLVTEFAQQVKGLERFAVLGDPDIESQFGVESLPTLFIVDRQGRLVTRLVGAGDESAVVALIEKLAAQ